MESETNKVIKTKAAGQAKSSAKAKELAKAKAKKEKAKAVAKAKAEKIKAKKSKARALAKANTEAARIKAKEIKAIATAKAKAEKIKINADRAKKAASAKAARIKIKEEKHKAAAIAKAERITKAKAKEAARAIAQAKTAKEKNAKNTEWLNLLKDALDSGVKLQVNHRFKYKNKNLGTFLLSAKRRHKTALLKDIENLGFNYKMHSNAPEDYLDKYIKQLTADTNPNKQNYITRFNYYVLPKKDSIKKQTIKKLNSIWKKKFGDVRKWEKPDNDIDKINQWKAFRYNTLLNPDGKWFHYKKYMGKLYGWVYIRKRHQEKMSLIVSYFNEMELAQLQKEGFQI